MVTFRSETMKHGTMVVPHERAREFVDLIGKATKLQLVDMNAVSMTRPYKKYIQRLDEMERILRFLTDEILKLPGAIIHKNQIVNFLENDTDYDFDKLEESLQELHRQFVKFRDNNDSLMKSKNAAIEERAVCASAIRSYAPATTGSSTVIQPPARAESLVTEEAGAPPGAASDSNLLGFSAIAGVMNMTDQERFRRTLFRATRGNVFSQFEVMDEQLTDDSGRVVPKCVFVCYFQGAQASALHEKISKICTAFVVRSYPWPRSQEDASVRSDQLSLIIGDKQRALEAYEEYFMSQVQDLLAITRPGGNSLIEEWRLFCAKERTIYATLNLFESSDSTLRADCWFPAFEEPSIHQALQSRATPHQVSAFLLVDKLESKKTPPTFFRTTCFTSAFQGFVNTYGVPRYKEANPALPTCITLPFLFGVMYGDIGHGLGVLCFGLMLIIIYEKHLKTNPDEMVQMFGGGRFMITMMGIYATYAGFMYNDFFSLGVNMFGPRYKCPDYTSQTSNFECEADYCQMFPYPFGFDPIWKGSVNEIIYFNSFKMKFSVIVALFQMSMGVFFKGANAIHFKDVVGFTCEFIPQLLFLWGLVGYMDFLIFYKWATPEDYPKPSIISTIINMFFFQVEEPAFFTNQKAIQTTIVIMMVICIPWMLLPKPLHNKWKHKKEKEKTNGGSRAQLSEHDVDVEIANSALDVDGDDEVEEYEFSEDFIHQVIETIEFVLGVISNTASYLRLWALSLAHQQLALVFFDMTVRLVLGKYWGEGIGGVVIASLLLFVAFTVFAGATFFVMFGMDSLECYLHALRLQWVEFQNKFFKGDGYAFEPLAFDQALKDSSKT